MIEPHQQEDALQEWLQRSWKKHAFFFISNPTRTQNCANIITNLLQLSKINDAFHALPNKAWLWRGNYAYSENTKRCRSNIQVKFMRQYLTIQKLRHISFLEKNNKSRHSQLKIRWPWISGKKWNTIFDAYIEFWVLDNIRKNILVSNYMNKAHTHDKIGAKKQNHPKPVSN